jgi:hypothetical protein
MHHAMRTYWVEGGSTVSYRQWLASGHSRCYRFTTPPEKCALCIDWIGGLSSPGPRTGLDVVTWRREKSLLLPRPNLGRPVRIKISKIFLFLFHTVSCWLRCYTCLESSCVEIHQLQQRDQTSGVTEASQAGEVCRTTVCPLHANEAVKISRQTEVGEGHEPQTAGKLYGVDVMTNTNSVDPQLPSGRATRKLPAGCSEANNWLQAQDWWRYFWITWRRGLECFSTLFNLKFAWIIFEMKSLRHIKHIAFLYKHRSFNIV